MLSAHPNNLQTLIHFLRTPTPKKWLDVAVNNIPLLLLDHAHCERKAAVTAIILISKYSNRHELVNLMSPLAREELLHFEKVLTLMKERNIAFGPLKPSNYAQTLHDLAGKKDNPERLQDLLLIGAIIEARSCERFHALVPLLTDKALARFYSTLVKAEARHFEEYLNLARLYGGSIDEKLEQFLTVENTLIQTTDKLFRFHSGIPS